MSAMIVIALIISAILMLLLSELDLDLRYKRFFSATFHIYPLALELTAKERSGDKKSKSNSKSSFAKRSRKAAVYLKTIIKLIEWSEIEINSLSVPTLNIFSKDELYKERALISSIISAFTVYLSTKALKLNQRLNSVKQRECDLEVDLTVKTRAFYVIYALIMLKLRLKFDM